MDGQEGADETVVRIRETRWNSEGRQEAGTRDFNLDYQLENVLADYLKLEDQLKGLR